ncbi:ATP-binding protein [Phaeacidiphilus oryzae]|uniref:ATP-binding protein n=1 Tax=Phaeacidiphilus oryzae TaxID=348818 RepID=UPI0007C6EBDB|nr:tetratricopeptide repeat protein [Phaeacidiphilus oryzae]
MSEPVGPAGRRGGADGDCLGEHGNLPGEWTSFIGRAAELDTLARLLTAPAAAADGPDRGSRLITLTGVGGVGKTRLALRAAASAAGLGRPAASPTAFPDGAWLVELSRLKDARLLGLTVCEALGATDQTTRHPVEVLREHLADKRLLLIADSCEHLAPHCRGFLTDLLAAAPGLRILATSRQALGAPGERTVVVPPLPAPAEGAALFADRAAGVRPGFTVDDRNRPAVTRLCERLEGIPLAIELAARRLRGMTVDEILAHLDDRFLLLTDDEVDVTDIDVDWPDGIPARHQALRTTIGWSHELCSPAERLLWSRLSVFGGDCDPDAAQEVCSDARLTAGAVREGVAALVDKSIVDRESTPAGPRLRMLDTVREYGGQWLAMIGDGEGARLSRRHRDHYIRFAEHGERSWFGPAQSAVFRAAQAERANLRAALEYCLTTPGELRRGLHLAGTLWYYWVGCGFLAEGRQWLDRVLALSRDPEHGAERGPERAKALWVNGYIATLQGDYPAATRMLEECREQARAAGDQRALAYAVHRLGCAALLQDEHALAEKLFTEALDRYREQGELNSNVLMGQVELAMALAFQGQLDRAVDLCTEVRAICAEHGEQWSLAYALYVLAQAELADGELDRATELAGEALRINHAFHDLLGTALPMELLALFAALRGRPEQAAVLQGGAGRIWTAVGPQLFGSKHFNAPHLRCEALARKALGDQAYEAAYRRGAALSPDGAVGRALSGG